jgi:predicted AAA+ superfamily ATPase
MMRTDLQKIRSLSLSLPQATRKGLVLLTGARQTGKTTLIRKIYRDLPYYDLDSPEIRFAVRNISASGWGKSLGNAILDEAQKEPTLFEKLKFAYDDDDITFSVILGSSQILLLKKIRESLAGRMFIFELWPLMLSEMMTDEPEAAARPLIEKISGREALASVLAQEPEILLTGENDKRMEAMKHLVSSARRYMEYLRLSYQSILLQPFSENVTSSVIKSPKIYWLDIGILRALTGFWGEAEGSLFETFVVSELYKWLKTSQSDAELFYYRTRSGFEIDVIMRLQGGIMGIEVKKRSNVDAGDCRALLRVAESLPPGKWKGGIVVYEGQKISRINDTIWAVPAHRLF